MGVFDKAKAELEGPVEVLINNSASLTEARMSELGPGQWCTISRSMSRGSFS